MSGQTFGNLQVLSPTDERASDGSVKWLCRCGCNKLFVASANNIKRGITNSCGCYQRKRQFETHKKYNTFTIDGEIAKGTTSNGTVFLVDAEDIDRIREYYWYENDQGYIVTCVGKNKFVRLHRMIMNAFPEDIIDHKNRDKKDNRKSNLRLATKQLNGINRTASKTNHTGVKGVSRSANGQKFVARICYNGKTLYLGTFPSIEEAYQARYDKEVELFGEFAHKEVVV